MHLPVLQSTPGSQSSDDRLRLFLRTQLHWGQALGDETDLEVGTAIVNPDLSKHPDANFVIQAALADDQSPQRALREVEEHFSGRQSSCIQWLMNHGSPNDRVAPLVAHLLANGYEEHQMRVLHLVGAPSQIVEVGGLKIIPARASHRHLQQLAQIKAAESSRSDDALAMLLHLDDPNWDSLLALDGPDAVATVGVLSVGDIGRLDQVYVAPSHRRRGIGRTMIARALEICARSVFQQVMVMTWPDQQAITQLFAGVGFTVTGEIPICRRIGF
ncbi:MAG: GNAT family N-acetyltransferase [Phycisphaerales bacterium]|nr:GNAT family N-acetyltransferase [Phycisphaerales bacterium]